jgi:Tol biopolymer transport system component
LIGLNGENFKPVTIEGLDFLPQWSPTGKRLLYSVDSARTDFKPELWIANAYGDEIGSGRHTIQLNTWANKCTFGDENTLFCAVPRDLPSGAGMAPDLVTSYDDIYKVDLATGAKIPIPLDDNNHRIGSISYNKQQNKLFFTDINNSGIFEAGL